MAGRRKSPTARAREPMPEHISPSMPEHISPPMPEHISPMMPEHISPPMPEHISPMLASAGTLPSRDDEYAFEVKWDGVRAIVYWRPGRYRLEGRTGKDIGERYPELRALGAQLGSHEAVLDGEIVAFDAHGKPSFARLQHRLNVSSPRAIRQRAAEIPVTYVIFDLLYLDGRITMDLPYRERRRLLEGLQLSGPSWQTPDRQQGDGRALLAATAEHGLEGIVAKRLQSLYRPGERTREWLKIKNVNRQELVIGGWLPGKGRRESTLGALLVGYYEPSVGSGRELRYAGRVGSGFDDAELERLTAELGVRARESSPFARTGVQPPRHARFVDPDLVAEIRYSRWTDDRILRHSVYEGLRPDKPASEVELELEPPPSPPASEVELGPPPSPLVWSDPRMPTTAGGTVSGGLSLDAATTAAAAATTTTTTGGPVSGGPSLDDDDGDDMPAPPYEVLHETARHTEIAVGGRTLRLSNRAKVLYPEIGFTKGQIVDYYAAVAPALLPHLADRALTLKRYPDGVDQAFFYEKRCPAHHPDWVRTAAIYSERERETIDYCVVDDLPTLLWVANLAAIELHPSLARVDDQQAPTAMAFDLDPGPPAGLRECCQVALLLRELLDAVSMRSLAKTSGAKGLQVYVPLNTFVTYGQTKPFARTVARLLEREHPKLVLSRMRRDLRAGKVLIDWSQNDAHKTTVSVYSLRALPRPTISTPLRWDEVEHAARSRRGGRVELSAEPARQLERVARDGDLFAPALDLAQQLPDFGAHGPDL